MDFELALKFVSSTIYKKNARPLTEIEVSLLYGAWNKLTYEIIANRSGYSINYLQRDLGPKFWKRLSDILGHKVNKTTFCAIITHLHNSSSTLSLGKTHEPITTVQHETDWGEAIHLSSFHGRTESITQLTQWMIHDRCKLITVVGMIGIGKTTLAAKVAQQLQEKFEFVIWRSLSHAPPLKTLLSELISFLSSQQDIQSTPERLLHWLQTRRCLVILDRQDALLQSDVCAGYYQPAFKNYGDLFQMMGEANHQSCILMTSREKTAEVAILEGLTGSVRSFTLGGSQEVSLAIIASKQLVGTEAEKCNLCDLYRCNPLALKIVSSAIQSLFYGEIAAFFQVEILVFNGIRRWLERQFEGISSTEQIVLVALASLGIWTKIAELRSNLLPLMSYSILLESLESLIWRSLIEQRMLENGGNPTVEYTLQPVIMEYFASLKRENNP